MNNENESQNQLPVTEPAVTPVNLAPAEPNAPDVVNPAPDTTPAVYDNGYSQTPTYLENVSEENDPIVEKAKTNKTKKFIWGFFKFILFLVSVFLILTYREEIAKFVNSISKPKVQMTKFKPNDYYKEVDYDYVQITKDFSIKNYQHLLNAYYTILNGEDTTFILKCDESYKKCLDDVNELANNKLALSNMNSFVHPYNTFSSLETEFDTFGKITIKISKAYNRDQIKKIEEKVKNIIATVTDPAKTHQQNIRALHDYIINNTVYDKQKSNTGQSNHESSIAYGPLIQGYALCGGYTDAMAIFLDYYNIKNYKVISENHIWNALLLDGKWYHLDLTWDDPVMSDGTNYLQHKFFLIDDKQLSAVQEDQHFYEKEVFTEVAMQ